MKYHDLIDSLCCRTNFSDDNVDNFQCDVDLFFHEWLKLVGMKGLTNYIFMLGSGHVSFYLHKWRNLYKYSQQGWETLNSMLNSFFFSHTQHGGYKSGGGPTSKVDPITLWLQRLLPFCTGEADEFLYALTFR